MKNEYYIDTTEPIVIIYLNNDKSTIIDLDDLSKLDNDFTYSVRTNGYVARTTSRKEGKKTTLYLHRELMKCPYGMTVDHINGNKLDNRKSNLRICTIAENSQNHTNKRPNTKSKYRGVIWSKRDNGWIARVKLNGKQHYLGTYVSEEMAAKKSAEFRKENMPYSMEV